MYPSTSTNPPRPRRQGRKVWQIIVPVVAVVAVGALVAVIVPRVVEDSGDDPPPGAADAPVLDTTLTPELQAAMERDLGLTGEQAQQRLATEAWATQTVAALSDDLGDDRYAGAWFTDDGELVVGVTDEDAAAAVRAAGAEPSVVDRSASILDAALAALDEHADELDAFLEDNVDDLQIESVSEAVAGWHIDVTSNEVVVHAPEWSEPYIQQFTDTAGEWSEAIQVVISDEQPKLLQDIHGGDEYHIAGTARCSVGFSVVGGFVTAGHCALGGVDTAGVDGTPQGEFVSASFPGVGGDGPDDWGVVAVFDNWTPQPLVNDYQGGTLEVAGSQEAPVGSSICRYGATTGMSCGEIQATDASVVYPEGTVSGLVRTDVCAEPGDSGGAWLTGNQAQGVTSGGDGDCTVGGTTFYQPVNEILDLNDLTLVTTDAEDDLGTEPPEQDQPDDPPADPPPGADGDCGTYEFVFRGELGLPYFLEIQPGGQYYRTLAAGTHTVCLTGVDGGELGDFDLALQQWDGVEWVTIDWSIGADSNELIAFDAEAGYFRIGVYSEFEDPGGYVLGLTVA